MSAQDRKKAADALFPFGCELNMLYVTKLKKSCPFSALSRLWGLVNTLWNHDYAANLGLMRTLTAAMRLKMSCGTKGAGENEMSSRGSTPRRIGGGLFHMEPPHPVTCIPRNPSAAPLRITSIFNLPNGSEAGVRMKSTHETRSHMRPRKARALPCLQEHMHFRVPLPPAHPSHV